MTLRSPLRTIGKGLLGLVLLGLAVLLVMQLWFLVHVIVWREVNPDSTRFMRTQLAVLQARNPKAALDHRWVDYGRISAHLKRAVIASEDANFPDHDGVDWNAIEQALEKNVKRGRVAFGGSTITMQLAKNLFLSGDRSYLRKGQELVIAYMLEAIMSKQRILEIYLNVAEWGVGVFGAEAAARHYFGVSAALGVPFEGLLDRLPVDAVVLWKAGILGSDHRALQVGRQLVVADPAVLQVGLRVALAQDLELPAHETRRGRIHLPPYDHMDQEPQLDHQDRGQPEKHGREDDLEDRISGHRQRRPPGR